MLVVDLGKWMNKILIDWGIDTKVADRSDCYRSELSVSGDSYRRNEAIHPSETTSLEHVVDEA